MTNETTTMRVRVLPGWLVSHDDGQQHGDGEELEVPADVADYWIGRGWVDRVEAKTRKGKGSH